MRGTNCSYFEGSTHSHSNRWALLLLSLRFSLFFYSKCHDSSEFWPEELPGSFLSLREEICTPPPPHPSVFTQRDPSHSLCGQSAFT